MSKWKVHEKNVVKFNIRISGGRGVTLSDDPDVQELVDFLTTPLPNNQVNPQELLTGTVKLRGEIARQ